MRKAEPQQPAAGLHLSQQLLAEFGGIGQVAAHFQAAPTAEASRNLLAIMLDHAAHQLTQVNALPKLFFDFMHMLPSAPCS